MCTSQADRPDPLVAAGERQAISNAVNEAVSAITDFAVIVTIIYKGRLDIQIDPARERHTVLRQIDRVFGRIEVCHLSYIQSDRAPVKRDRGHVIAPSRQ